MNGHNNKWEDSHITITEAVETLSDIAEMEVDRDTVLALQEDMLDDQTDSRSIKWLQENDPDTNIEIVKETFRVILHYLKNYYKNAYRYMPNQKTTEGIKAIMVLVGEAAKKLDRYTALNPQYHLKSITQLKEYQRLQDFYLSRIARRIDEGVLSRWIMALSQRALDEQTTTSTAVIKTIQTKHAFVDLDAVKKDTEYELFFIRKEDGSRFFSPRLIRNIKLVCDFGDNIGDSKQDNPLESLEIWKDKTIYEAARSILQGINPTINRFYQEHAKANDSGDLSHYLSKALMALMLCGNKHNILHDRTVKSCLDYFIDFQVFLAKALHSREYENYIAYPPKKTDKLASSLLDLANALCYSLYANIEENKNLLPYIVDLIQEATQLQSQEHTKAWAANHTLWSHLASDYKAMTKLLKNHANGPLTKVLNVLESDSYTFFDPMQQGNLPSHLFDLDFNNKSIAMLRIPSPTHQEFIHKANVIEEFKGFIRSFGQNKGMHLVINFQDRSSWREYARCAALEDLQKLPEFANHLTVVTFPKDTEFYHQEASYSQNTQAETFMEHFKEHLFDESCGFFFPEDIKKALVPFVDQALKVIHRTFFGGKNVLTRERRLNFIEIFYTFLQMKLIELIKPTSISLTCKDGIDISSNGVAQLFAFLKLINEKSFSKSDVDQLSVLLHLSSLMERERIIQPESFMRMISMIREVENLKQDLGADTFIKLIHEACASLFQANTLNLMPAV